MKTKTKTPKPLDEFLRLETRIPCSCGSYNARWYGDRYGLRSYLCDDCAKTAIANKQLEATRDKQSLKASLMVGIKSTLSLAILLAITSVQAGTLKLPGSNITRNAGTSIPVLVQASGFPAGSVATISLVNAKTWQSTEWAWVPIVNGNNSVNLALYWSFVDVGNYVIKVKVNNNQCTSTWLAKVRSAVIWPYSGSVFYRGAAAAVTWTVPTVWPLPIVGDFFDISLANETSGEGYEVLDSFVDPNSGRLDFIVPDLSPGTYRILINGWFYMEEWQDEWDFPWPDQTRSEKITIR